MDTMTVLDGILKAGLENVAVFAIHDPWAVQQMIKAGIGAAVTLPLGGKLDMPAIGRKGEPLEVSG
jgi:microcystin degradation protein MlrC